MIRFPGEDIDFGVETHTTNAGDNPGWLRDCVARLIAERDGTEWSVNISQQSNKATAASDEASIKVKHVHSLVAITCGSRRFWCFSEFADNKDSGAAQA